MTASTLDLRQIRPLIDRKVAILYLGLAFGIAPMWPFAWHLALHVLGAILLIGNALAMAVWLVIAGSSGNDAWKRRAAHAVNVGDVWFTVPGVALILANGLAMVVERYGGAAAFTSTPFVGLGLVLADGHRPRLGASTRADAAHPAPPGPGGRSARHRRVPAAARRLVRVGHARHDPADRRGRRDECEAGALVGSGRRAV